MGKPRPQTARNSIAEYYTGELKETDGLALVAQTSDCGV